jgi:hypothetical protein
MYLASRKEGSEKGTDHSVHGHYLGAVKEHTAGTEQSVPFSLPSFLLFSLSVFTEQVFIGKRYTF